MILQVKKLSDLAILPTKNVGDAGYDLYSTEDYVLERFERHLFKTDLAISIPTGYYGRIADRSGNAFKLGLHVMAGVVDSTYRGNVGVILINLNCEPHLTTRAGVGVVYHSVPISKGDRIAQIVFEKYNDFDLLEVADLDQTIRNEGGFGSSGR